MTLAAVAEDSSHGAAADWAIGQLFSAVREARGRQVGETLRRSLQATVETVHAETRGGLGLSATAAVIWRGQLFVSHTGQSAAFHVHGNDVRTLTGLGGPRIGGSDTPWVESSPMAGRPLERGDRVILVSDGLLQASPEDGKPFLDPKAVPEYVSGVPPMEAARHLISIALGRDAPDDLAVAVVAMPGVAREPARRGLRRFALAALGLLVVAAVAITVLGLLQDDGGSASDYGYAVLIDGRLQGEGEIGSVQLLEPLPADSVFTALQDSNLGFQSTFNAGSDISASTMVLGSGARVRLTSLDRRQPESGSVVSPTQINLLLGQAMLMRSSGERDLRIALPDGVAGLLDSGRGALAATLDATGSEIVCLIGTCYFRPQGADASVLFAGQLLRPAEGGPRLHDPAVYLDWDRRCGGCLSRP